MSAQKKWLRLFLALIIGVISTFSHANAMAESVTLYTPYTKISIPPGQPVEYSVDVINNGKEVQTVDLSVTGLPLGWTYSLKSSSWTIGQISTLPGERKSLTLKVDIPLKVNKGNYRFNLIAGSATLPLTVNISEQGTYKTEFTTTQLNMQGNVSSTFTYNCNLKNSTDVKQQYAFMADAPRGWSVVFKVNYQAATSANVEPNIAQNIGIEIKAPDKTPAGKYKIPVTAASGSMASTLDLEVVITGSYNMELSTPTGLLSFNITAGETKQIDLVVNNTGSSELTDIKPEASAPVNWSVTFNPVKIDRLPSGQSTHIYAAIKADSKAIPGDYATNIEAKTPEASSKVAFRISVETPVLWGWVGVLIIVIALGSVYRLFRKYGRR